MGHHVLARERWFHIQSNLIMANWDILFRQPTPEEIGETMTEREFARRYPNEYKRIKQI